MKKTIAMLLILSVLALLVGCAKEAPPEIQPIEQVTTPVDTTVSTIEQDVSEIDSLESELDTSELEELDQALADLESLELD